MTNYDPIHNMSLQLLRQGYSAQRIARLNHTVPQFRKRFQTLVTESDRILAKLEAQPDAYHLLDDLEDATAAFLSDTNRNRAQWLGTPLAQSA